VSSCLRGKGFTLIELVVSVALISMVLFFAGSIFKVSIGSYRTATAQAEIMQKLRAITEQLNADFRGIRKDSPMFVWFQLDPNDPNNRFDQIMFFADGDFQSTRLYSGTPKVPSLTGNPVISNVARIQYCHARVYSPTAGRFVEPSEQQFDNAFDRFFNINHRTLARRQHLLTADPNIVTWPKADSIADFQTSFIPADNNNCEHDTLSLSQWQAMTCQTLYDNVIIDTCFTSPYARPSLSFGTGEGLHMLMSEGVSNLTIQLADESSGVLNWLPLTATVGGSGIFFNAPGGVGIAYAPYWTDQSAYWPRALKFTFTLYDSKGVFREGQTFTHIVYLDD